METLSNLPRSHSNKVSGLAAGSSTNPGSLSSYQEGKCGRRPFKRANSELDHSVLDTSWKVSLGRASLPLSLYQDYFLVRHLFAIIIQPA